LTHALLELSGEYPCGCMIESELLAWRVQLFAYQDLGRRDLLAPYSNLWKQDGSFDEFALRQLIKEKYPECKDR